MTSTMALTWFQRLQVAFRGWSRRREEDAKRREQDLLRRNVTWGSKPEAAPGPVAAAPRSNAKPIDLEGLQVAYLDESGQIGYYLDVESGNVVEARDAATRANVEKSERFKVVPSRTLESEAEDRSAFIATLEPSSVRQSLSMTTNANDFRKVLTSDRSIERSWYNFKNQRATSAIESWLQRLGLR